jgi:hypothetical protein
MAEDSFVHDRVDGRDEPGHDGKGRSPESAPVTCKKRNPRKGAASSDRTIAKVISPSA